VAAYIDGDRELRVALRGWVGRERFKLALHRFRYRFIRQPSPPEAAAPLRPA
jgi:hypothetical protein